LGAIEAEVSKQCDALPRGEFASKALGHSFTVFARDMVEVIICSSHSLLVTARFIYAARL
jgi:histidinol dehydrogenase